MSSPESSSSKALVNASKSTPSAKSSSTTPSKKHSKHPQSTPVKIIQKKKGKDLTKPTPEGFGGSTSKVNSCKVCESERDDNFIGGTCCYCLKACRQLFEHQSISKILPCSKSMGEVKGQSLALRPKKAGQAKRTKDDLLETVVSTLGDLKPRLDDILQRLQRLEEANSKKQKSK